MYYKINKPTKKERAVSLLNYKKPEHPPDIYFIRRNQALLNKFMDDDEMNKLVRDAAPRYRNNYKLFELDPREKKIIYDIKNKRRSFLNPDDPFYTKQYNQPFKQ